MSINRVIFLLANLEARLAQGVLFNDVGQYVTEKARRISSVRTGQLKRSLMWKSYPAQQRYAFQLLFYGLPYFSKQHGFFFRGEYRKEIRRRLKGFVSGARS